MSLRNIFRSLCLILRPPHDALFPLGLIFPLNLSLGICPAEENIYLKFPLAFKTRPVAAPAAWLHASRPCLSLVSPATRAVTARTAALTTLSQSSIILEYFGSPKKAKGPGFACKGGRRRSPDQPEYEPMQLCCLPEQQVTLSGAVDNISALVPLYFSVSPFLFNSSNRLRGRSQAWRKQLQEFTSNKVLLCRDWLTMSGCRCSAQ